MRVQPTLQLPNHPHIFAAGDIIEWLEEKQAMKAMAHAPLIVQNIVTVLNSNGQPSLKPYKTGTEMIVLTNGAVSSSYISCLRSSY